MQRRLVVKNIQQYTIGRGRFVFPPKVEKEVVTTTKQQYLEIKACVYLQRIVDEPYEPSADTDEAPNATVTVNGAEIPGIVEETAATAPQLPPHVTKDGDTDEADGGTEDASEAGTGDDTATETETETATDPDLYQWMIELFGVQPKPARLLWEAGFQDVESLRQATEADITNVPGVAGGSWKAISAVFENEQSDAPTDEADGSTGDASETS